MSMLKLIGANFKDNSTAGFLVFLIALPLCMGIAFASGFPPVAGVVTAVIGGLVTPWFSDSELTIKGPAAGMIVIVLGCMLDFGFTAGQNPAADFNAYRLTLGVAVIAGLCQIILGSLKAGVLGEIFPATAVHGLLSAIGLIIMIKQFPIALGETVKGTPLEIVLQMPKILINANPEIAMIGVISLVIMFTWPVLAKSSMKKYAIMRIPAQLIVVGAALGFSYLFDLVHPHSYKFFNIAYDLSQNMLVPVPETILKAVTFPTFAGLSTANGWKWVFMFAFIGSLESIISAKAIDQLDPQKRKTNLDKDLFAIGLANTLAACLGGLPMISEIVRSKANIDSGAKSRSANMMHGVFLLTAIVALGPVLHHIPLAALAAMLVYTGFRLAHPNEFLHAYKIGSEQLVIFVATIVATLATDLLVGIATGLFVKLAFHIFGGVKFREFYRADIKAQLSDGGNTVEFYPKGAAVFTNWLTLRRKLDGHGLNKNRNVVVDLSKTRIIDHTMLSKLEEYKIELERRRLSMTVRGLETLQSTNGHPLSMHRRPAEPVPVTVGRRGSGPAQGQRPH